MRAVKYTAEEKSKYLIATLLLGTCMALNLTNHVGIGCLIAGFSLGLAYSTAQKNGRITQLGKKNGGSNKQL